VGSGQQWWQLFKSPSVPLRLTTQYMGDDFDDIPQRSRNDGSHCALDQPLYTLNLVFGDFAGFPVLLLAAGLNAGTNAIL